MSTSVDFEKLEDLAEKGTIPEKGGRIIADLLRRLEETRQKGRPEWNGDWGAWVNSWRHHKGR